MHDFACAGLRTLCVARRTLDPDYYAKWNALFHKASVSVNNRKAKLEKLAEEIEIDLQLLGATGLLDLNEQTALCFEKKLTLNHILSMHLRHRG